MRLGTFVIVWTAAAAGVAVGGAALAMSALGAGPAIGLPAAGLLSLITALGAAGLTLPLAIGVTREEAEMRRCLDRIEQAEDFEPPRGGRWLRPLQDSVRRAVSGLAERLDDERTRLRELEVRQRVTEGEREHVEAVLQSLQDAVIVTDVFNEVTMANGPAAELLGFDLEAALHRSVDEVVNDPALRDLIRQTRDAASASHRRHVEHVLGNGAASSTSAEDGGSPPEAAFDVTLACLPSEQRQVGGVVTILRDITREREISQMKSEFVSKASHELRTPLSSINAYVEMLLDGDAEDETSRQEFYQVIKSEADRLGRLIDNMLNISRIEAGIVTVSFVDLDFTKAAHEAAEVIRPQAALKDVSVSVHSGPLAHTAMADKDMIHQVLLNLLSNAVKYTPEGGRVSVTIEDDDATSSVMVSVADTGLGIPPDALPKLFDKFYRVENYKRIAKGTGLGLNLVKHIVETVHHGQVSVTSEIGMGSKFVFTIPYRQEGA